MYRYSWRNVSLARFWLNKCSDFKLFCFSYNPDHLAIAVRNNRIKYGASGLGITNTIFTNGYMDPFFFEGIFFTREDNSTAITIRCKYL